MHVIDQGWGYMSQMGLTTARVARMPRISRMRFACLLSALLLCVLPGDGAQQGSQMGAQMSSQTSTIRIQGTVRTVEGKRLGLIVKVQLEGENGGLITERLTDSDGAYYFDNLTGRGYRLVVTAPGYEKHEEYIESSVGLRLRVCNITLASLPKNSEQATAPEPRSDSLAPKQAKKDYDKALKELAAQHLDKAKAHLESAVKAYPCYARAQAHLATILEAHREPAGAEAALRKALECDPDYLSSYTLLGQFLNRQKRFAESVPVLEAGERRSPAFWALRYELGIAYFGIEQYAKAESEYQKVSEFSPSPPPDLPLRLADVHIKVKAYDKAYAEMKQYLAAQPNGPYAAKVRDIMQRADALNVPAQHPQKQ